VILLRAVVVSFLQPVGEIGVHVSGFLNAQEVNDAGIFFLRLCDAAVFQTTAEDEDDIEPVLAHGHGRKDRSHLEENSCLRRRNHDLATSSDQVIKLLVQLNNLLWLAIEMLFDRELAARVRLMAIGEPAPTLWTGPKRLRLSALRSSLPHYISHSSLLLPLLRHILPGPMPAPFLEKSAVSGKSQ
jgi:hypothetical protein